MTKWNSWVVILEKERNIFCVRESKLIFGDWRMDLGSHWCCYPNISFFSLYMHSWVSHGHVSNSAHKLCEKVMCHFRVEALSFSTWSTSFAIPCLAGNGSTCRYCASISLGPRVIINPSTMSTAPIDLDEYPVWAKNLVMVMHWKFGIFSSSSNLSHYKKWLVAPLWSPGK